MRCTGKICKGYNFGGSNIKLWQKPGCFQEASWVRGSSELPTQEDLKMGAFFPFSFC